MATKSDTTRGNWLTEFLFRREGGSRFSLKDMATYTYLVLGTIIMFGPVLWLVMSSFKDESLLFEENPTFLPYRQITAEVQDVALLEYDDELVDITLRGATVLEKDIPASNGILQMMDRVILSPELESQIRALDTSQADTSLLPRGAARERLEGDTGNVLQILKDERDFSVLVELLGIAGLQDALADADNITVFAPNDDAFEALVLEYGEATVAALVAKPDLLAQVLQYHVADGQVTFLDLYNRRAEPITTLGGEALPISVDHGDPLPVFDITFNDLRLGDSVVITPDIEASNGWIHAVDAVIVPPDFATTLAELDTTGADTSLLTNIPAAEPQTELVPMPQTLAAQPDLTLLAQAIQAAELGDALSGEERLTILAPTNAAFAAFAEQFGAEVVAALFLPDNQALLQQLLSAHVLTDRYKAVNLYQQVNSEVATLAETTLPVAMVPGETERLAQIGSPLGANFAMIDPDNPSAGVRVIASYATPAGPSAVFTPIREVHFNTDNYTEALDAFNFSQYLFNTVFVTVIATAITLLINSMAAFGLSKYKFRGRDVVFIVIISTLMVPISVILIPAFVVVSRLGMTNSLWGIIIPGAATPTGVFLLRQYMLTIPDELIDAARIDGASEWRIYWQVILPLARPALAVLAIFSIMWRWNDFLWPLIVLSRNELFTLQVGLNAFQGALDVQWHYILAMTVLTLLPITIVFAFLQRYITSGIATTGLK